MYCFDNDKQTLEKELGLTGWKHNPHGNSDYYLKKVDIPSVTKQVKTFNNLVENGQAPTAKDLQTMLTAIKGWLPKKDNTTSEPLQKAFDISNYVIPKMRVNGVERSPSTGNVNMFSTQNTPYGASDAYRPLP